MSLEDELRRLGRTDQASFDGAGSDQATFGGKVDTRIAHRRLKRRRLQIAAVACVALAAIVAIASTTSSRRSGEVVTVVEPTVGPSKPTIPESTSTAIRATDTTPSTTDPFDETTVADTAPVDSTEPPVPQTLVDSGSIVGLNGLEPVVGGTSSDGTSHTAPSQTGPRAAPCTIAALSAASGVPAAGLSRLTCESGWASVSQGSTAVMFFDDVGGAWNLVYTVTLQGSKNTTTACPPSGIPADLLAGLVPSQCLSATSTPTTGTPAPTSAPSSTTSPVTTKPTPTTAPVATTTSTTGPSPTTVSP